MKNKGGRPSPYLKDYHPEDYISECKKGKTKTQIAAKWDIDADTLLEWSKKHKKFSGAVRKGKVYAKAFWINLAFMGMIGKANISGQNVRVDFRYFNWIMMNCFGMGKDKRPAIINIELKKLVEDAKSLQNLSDNELIMLAEREIKKAKNRKD